MDTETQHPYGQEDAPAWQPASSPDLAPTPSAPAVASVAAAPALAVTPLAAVPAPRRRGMAGIALAMVGAAALASGGTVAALGAAGALDHQAITVVAGEGQGEARQSVALADGYENVVGARPGRRREGAARVDMPEREGALRGELLLRRLPRRADGPFNAAKLTGC